MTYATLMKSTLFTIVALTIPFASLAEGANEGVINDPEGFVNVLVLEKHEYYEKLKPSAIGDTKVESIHGFDRLYAPHRSLIPFSH